jgi:Glyoxalase/Bleomycin resistance protein/Dioxygenase superfamily
MRQPGSSRRCSVRRSPAASIPPALYPVQQRVTIRLGGQKVLIAPPHPNEPNVSAPPFPHYGLEHIGLTVDDVDAAVAELRAKGAEIAIGPVTRNPGLRLAFVRGPEGIMIELVQRYELPDRHMKLQGKANRDCDWRRSCHWTRGRAQTALMGTDRVSGRPGSGAGA